MGFWSAPALENPDSSSSRPVLPPSLSVSPLPRLGQQPTAPRAPPPAGPGLPAPLARSPLSRPLCSGGRSGLGPGSGLEAAASRRQERRPAPGVAAALASFRAPSPSARRSLGRRPGRPPPPPRSAPSSYPASLSPSLAPAGAGLGPRPRPLSAPPTGLSPHAAAAGRGRGLTALLLAAVLRRPRRSSSRPLPAGPTLLRPLPPLLAAVRPHSHRLCPSARPSWSWRGPRATPAEPRPPPFGFFPALRLRTRPLFLIPLPTLPRCLLRSPPLSAVSTSPLIFFGNLSRPSPPPPSQGVRIYFNCLNCLFTIL